jgi:hypothetical protein
VRRATVFAGVGGITFGTLTVVAVFVSNMPGSNYKASDVADYLAKGHRVAGIVAMYLGFLAVGGLICLLAHLRDVLGAEPGNARAASILWGTGLAAAASFAIGWGVAGGQIIAHLEGGSGLSIAPPVTHLIGELGVIFIFGSGSVLLGFSLIALMLASRTALPKWLRWSTLLAGLCGIAGPAFFTFFLLLLWAIVTGVWLLVAGRGSEPAAMAAQPSG